MRSPSMHVRQKVIALLVALTALWIFAAVVTVREGMNLLFVNALNNGVGLPTETLVDTLQQERKLSVIYLSDSKRREELAAHRLRTDQVLASWRKGIADTNLGLMGSDQLRDAIRHAASQLDKLVQYRRDIDNGGINRADAVALFNTMIDASFRIYGSLSSLDDQEFAKQARTLVALSRARELLLQEHALLSGALRAGSFTQQDIVEFTKLVGAQRFLYASTSAELPSEDRALYEQAAASPAVSRLRVLEDQVLQQAKVGAGVPFSAGAWEETVDAAAKNMRDMEYKVLAHLLQRAEPLAVGVISRLVLAGFLGLLAVVAAIIISITTARRLVQQLEKLRDAARELAETRLPQVVDRLSQGQEVDVAAEAPPLSGFGNDEIGQVGQAFNAVQETAISAAVQQADLRRGVRDVFLSLARRTQNLVHKQLGMLDAMERRADPDEMEDLFRIDHLATRMRRSAENLIVLSGATPGRMWRRPVAMIDVIRGALGEVEDYTRVNLLPIDQGALTGRAVGDVIHLLAELIENAVSYSPPYTGVNVGGQGVANGFVVEIEDRGLGMSDEDLASANKQLADPPDFSLADASKLGHYVVAKLAQRHGIKVHVRHSPYGGTAAIVLIPSELMVKSDETAPALPAGQGKAPVVSFQRPDIPSQPTRDQGRASELPQRNPAAASATLTGDVLGMPADGLTTTTPAGLPWRVRQANLAPQLREDSDAPDEEDYVDEQPARDPELIRRMMRSYQTGTARGRSEATGDTDNTIAGQSSNGGDAAGNVGRHVAKDHLGDRQEG